ncbi:MAG: PilZ domain-containing protein [Inquilinus sp.]|nr:PilZ domain-containing protein [Inquilinus sp.]
MLEARLGGGIYRSLDWSLAGFAVSNLAEAVDPASTGMPVTGYFGLADDALVFKFEAVIARIDRERDAVGFAFTNLWPESRDLLRRLFWHPSLAGRQDAVPVRPRSPLLRAFTLASRRGHDEARR